MISLNGIATPEVLLTLDYEEILAKKTDNFKLLVPDWKPIESDEYSVMLEASSYDELHLRAEFNKLAKAFFLPFSTGTDLDFLAFTFYGGIQRLEGSKPYATYEFILSEVLSQDVLIPANLLLSDETNSCEAILLEDVLIVAGSDKASGVVELQLETSSSEVKIQSITTPLPFVVEASATESFTNGSSVESDEEFKTRILLSMADKSTAGSEESYKSFTFNADERVEDVSVRNALKPLSSYVSLFVDKNEDEILAALREVFEDMATVELFYYSKDADELMQTRIVETLNAKEVRPLTDTLRVAPVTQIPFSVNAELKILPNQETETIYSNAITALSDGLNSLKKIGTDITLSEINGFLKVPGTKEVIILEPTTNIVVTDDSIGVNSGNTITYTVL